MHKDGQRSTGRLFHRISQNAMAAAGMVAALLGSACGGGEAPPSDGSVADASPVDAWPIEEQNGCWAIRTLILGDQPLGHWPSIALDDSGHVHIAHVTTHAQQIDYLTNRSGDWQNETIEEYDTESASHTGIGVADDGAVHILFQLASATAPPAHVTLENGTVQRSEIDVGSDVERIKEGPWVVVGSAGVVHAVVVTFDRDWDELLTHYRLDDAGWTRSVIASAAKGFGQAAITLGPDGEPHVSYALKGDLFVATPSQDGWTSTLIADSAGFNDIAVDAEGYMHVVYAREEDFFAGERLIYVTDRSGTWQSEDVHDGDWTNGKCNIAVSDAGVVHIVFEGFVPLRHAVKDGGEWRLAVIHERGFSPELILDADGRPHVTYSDSLAGENYFSSLRYATCQ